MPLTWTEITDEHWDDTLKNVAQLAREVGRTAFPAAQDQGRDAHLVTLWGLGYLTEAVRETARDEAFRAGSSGANYSDLATAWRVSQQAARKQWAGASSAASSQRQWFGTLLRWSRTGDGGWIVEHHGDEYTLVKLERRELENHPGGTRPGWHFTTHPASPDEGNQIGPGLGRTIEAAKLMAELWLLTPEQDRQPHDDAPNVLLAFSGSGVVFGPSLLARLDQRRRCVTIHHGADQDAEVIAVIRPIIEWIPDLVLGERHPHLTWRSALRDGTELGDTNTWWEACRLVINALPKKKRKTTK